MVGRCAVHRRRLRVLARRSVPEQGAQQSRPRRSVGRAASRASWRRWTSGSVQVPGSVLPAAELLSVSTAISGQATQGLYALGGYAAHYLKQFHPKYARPGQGWRVGEEANFDNWVNHFKFKGHWSMNPDLPVVSPWKTTQPANTPTWVFERNPYSIWVDTEGNGSRTSTRSRTTWPRTWRCSTSAPSPGEYDYQAGIDIGKLLVIIENQQKETTRSRSTRCW